jgi:hypothetical protein
LESHLQNRIHARRTDRHPQAHIAGIRAFAVHAKDDEARAFYAHFDFVASPTDPMHLFLLLKDIKALLD